MAKQNRKAVRSRSKKEHPGDVQIEAKKKASRKQTPNQNSATYIDSYLSQGTGWSSSFWFNWIGERISYHSKPVFQDGVRRVHDTTNTPAWLKDLVQFVHDTILPKEIYDWSKMDENIIVASIVGVILSHWSCRIIRAKSYDGRRPIEVRQNMMLALNQLHHTLFECMVNEAKDHIFCPSQGWDPPFAPGAQDGDYV